MRRSSILPFLLLLTAGAHAEVTITGAYPTDRAGTRTVPKLGEPFFITVELSAVDQTTPYRVTIDAPSGKIDSDPLNFGVGANGGYWIRRGEVIPLYDGPIDVIVSCTAAKAPFKFRIAPTAPLTALEAYVPQKLSGRYGVSVVFDRTATRLLGWTPLPVTSAFQKIDALDAPIKQGLAKEAAQPIGLVEVKKQDRISISANVTLTASSVRTNLSLLRSGLMSAVPSNSVWLKPETQIQSKHKEIVAFAQAATKGMTKKTPVADVALAVYSAVLKRSVYTSTSAVPDALATLRRGYGECGDLSALFVAGCRSVGVPARAVSGFTKGDDQWHVWAEFFVPGTGWVPVDPAYALGRRPHSEFPLYFGVMPEMRDRLAICTGFNQTLGKEASTFLQTPLVFAYDKGIRAVGIVTGSHLESASVKLP